MFLESIYRYKPPISVVPANKLKPAHFACEAEILYCTFPNANQAYKADLVFQFSDQQELN